MEKKGKIQSFLGEDTFHKHDNPLCVVHVHVFPEWLQNLVHNGTELKVNGRQKKDLLTNIIAYLVSNDILTQTQIAEIAECSDARISQIMKTVKEQEKNKSTTF